MFEKLFGNNKNNEAETESLRLKRAAFKAKIEERGALSKDEYYLDDKTANLQAESQEFHHSLEGDDEVATAPAKATTDWIDDDIKIKSAEERIQESARFHRILNRSLALAGAVFIVVLIVVGWLLLQDRGGIDPNQIAARVNVPATVIAGEVFDLEVSIQNLNEVNVANGVLITRYGDFASDDQGQEITRTPVGIIGAGQTRDISVPVIISGAIGEDRVIKFELEYSPPDSSNKFAVEFEREITIERSPISVRINLASELKVGESSDFEIQLSTTDALPTDNYQLVIDRPADTVMEFESIEADVDGRQVVIPIDQLVPGSPLVFDGTVRTNQVQPGLVRFEVYLKSGELTIARTNSEFEVVLTPLVVEGRSAPDLAINNSSTINFDLISTTPAELREVEIIAEIIGDVRGVSARNGIYSSVTQQARFNPSTTSNLQALESGSDFDVSLSLTPVSGDNVIIRIKAYGFQGSASPTRRLLLDSEYEYPLQSDISAIGYATYRRSNFVNRGPLPPRVDQATTYTLYLQINARQGSLSPVSLQAVIPENVTIVSGLPSGFSIQSGRLVWNDIGRTDSAVFQVEIVPDPDQVGRPAELLENIVLVYSDGRQETSGRITDITTDITQDSGYRANIGIVAQ